MIKRSTLIDYWILALLVLVSLLMIFAINDRQEISGLYGVALDIRGAIYRPIWYVRQLIDMKKELRQLQHENALLRLENSEYRETYYENKRLRKLLSFDLRQNLKAVPAKVLGKNDIGIRTMIIGVGRADDIRPNMPVVSANGLVGKVLHVGEHTASVHLVTDRNFRIAVRDQQSRVEGLFEWLQSNRGIIKAVHHSANVRKGHTIITSGMSALFPPGIKVGKISHVDTTASALFRNVRVELSVDFNSLEEVFVVYKNGFNRP